MNITIIGAGAYGLALANVLNEKNKITVYSVNKEEINKLNNTYKNEILFPKIELPKNIIFTNDLELSLSNVDIVIIAIPTNFIDEISEKIKNKITKKTIIIIASKGINQKHCKFGYDIIKEQFNIKNIYVLSGPSFASDLIRKEKLTLTLAGKHKKSIKQIFPNSYIKIETINDIIGTELCGTLKNVFAIASGILDGLSVSESTKATFLTKIINETKEIIIKMKGKKNTILKSCGIGDILLTCTSKNSRNYTLGFMIANKDESLKQYIENTTIEGLEALTSIKKILNERKINCEIIDIIYDIIYRNEEPSQILNYIN